MAQVALFSTAIAIFLQWARANPDIINPNILSNIQHPYAAQVTWTALLHTSILLRIKFLEDAKNLGGVVQTRSIQSTASLGGKNGKSDIIIVG